MYWPEALVIAVACSVSPASMTPSPSSRNRRTVAPAKVSVPSASVTSASPSTSWKTVPAMLPVDRATVALRPNSEVLLAPSIAIALTASPATRPVTTIDQLPAPSATAVPRYCTPSP